MRGIVPPPFPHSTGVEQLGGTIRIVPPRLVPPYPVAFFYGDWQNTPQRDGTLKAPFRRNLDFWMGFGTRGRGNAGYQMRLDMRMRARTFSVREREGWAGEVTSFRGFIEK